MSYYEMAQEAEYRAYRFRALARFFVSKGNRASAKDCIWHYRYCLFQAQSFYGKAAIQ